MELKIQEAWFDINNSLMIEGLSELFPGFDVCMPLEWENYQNSLSCHINMVNYQKLHLLILVTENEKGNLAVYQREIMENDPEYKQIFSDQ